jgi:hypothetical protein
MDLQTTTGKPVTSDNAYPSTNFWAYSRQITDDYRREPATVGRPSEQFAFTASPYDVKPTVADPGHLG